MSFLRNPLKESFLLDIEGCSCTLVAPFEPKLAFIGKREFLRQMLVDVTSSTFERESLIFQGLMEDG
jgi:hypothetical protein